MHVMRVRDEPKRHAAYAASPPPPLLRSAWCAAAAAAAWGPLLLRKESAPFGHRFAKCPFSPHCNQGKG